MTQSLTPRGLTETQAPPNDNDILVYDLATDRYAPEAPTLAALGVTAVAADINLLAGLAAAGDRVVKVAKVVLAALDTAGGVLSWPNPEGASILVVRLVIDITTVATAACTLDFGTTTASAATLSDTLIDGIDSHTAIGVFDNLLAAHAGTNGKTALKLASGKWVTGSMASGAAAGQVGAAYIHYILA